ncbi:MAG: D-tyrosyl-tRNA(Tyr) deacylase [Armatimonadetes bacterium]|nr:D-tyrosyl-tRNA(Tyr) deacylase [Armatimonadota bacterium]
MRVVVQRVSRAALTTNGEPVGSLETGLVVLAGFCDADGPAELEWMAGKLLGLRVFPDEAGNLNRSLEEIGGGLIVVPNFTLYGDCRKGRRPSFTDAAQPERALPLYEQFVARLRESGRPLVSGTFGAHMHVELVNDGPVTLILDRGEGL